MEKAFIGPADLAESSPCEVPYKREKCPFCGHWRDLEAVLYGGTESYFPTFRVLCVCGAAGPIGTSKKSAWRCWNNRLLNSGNGELKIKQKGFSNGEN